MALRIGGRRIITPKATATWNGPIAGVKKKKSGLRNTGASEEPQNRSVYGPGSTNTLGFTAEFEIELNTRLSYFSRLYSIEAPTV
jgi:hypothetical protein